MFRCFGRHGRVSRGLIAVGDTLELVGRTDVAQPIVIKSEISRGQVLSAPGSIQPHQQCRAELYLLTAGEGGIRRASPVSATW
jgi:translation elongation factor EF-Tu-like GTPase